ncbi:extracellular solute-binding protein [Paenibacillus sp. GCM10023248]|uniref:extracellular solute-binding protein n=1 Tax=unclassified Paenibacillus TaxID=185978 RepID=UPI002377F426|nr:extracellular solute-binding protein [Paenibacillus sp. MAHUQ-63]MDD9271574.1 extracellular solute-binding protein [Paenibacillus sp. MAHUQ-63]
MRKRDKAKSAVILSAAGLMVLSACSSSSTEDNTAKATEKPGAATPPANLMAKYEKPVDITAWRYTEATYKYENGDTIENNIYTKAYQNELGINLKYQWTVPIEQFDQKLNVAIAAGDLPDIMWLKNKQLTDLTDNDMLYDLTELYEKYASPMAKSILQQDQKAFNTAKIGGKLMAIPQTSSAIDGLPLFYVRTDWLNKLGLSEPKSMKDVLAVAEAFTKKDPDGNGKDDTFGMAFTKTFLTDSHFGTSGFFSGFHAYAGKWVKNASGNLVYGSTLPETKAALKQLQDMYAQGLLDKEFGVKDRAKVTESVAGGKVGIFYGSMSAPLSITQKNIDNDPKAEWKAIPLLSIDDKKATPIGKMPIQRYYAVSKKSKNPEAIIKLLNFAMDGYDESKKPNPEMSFSKTNIPVYLYSLMNPEPANKNLNAHHNALSAIAANDPSKLSTEEKGYYDKIVDFRKGNKANWGTERVFGSPSSFDVISQYVKDDNYMLDAFYGAATPTMVEKNASLQKMEEEVFTKIIMGQSIDTFDKFVEDWKKLGGDQIAKEVNDWYAKNK